MCHTDVDINRCHFGFRRKCVRKLFLVNHTQFHTYEYGVSDEEDRGVVTHQVPITIFRVKLNSKPTWITC